MVAMDTFIKRLLAVSDPSQMKVCLSVELSTWSLVNGSLHPSYNLLYNHFCKTHTLSLYLIAATGGSGVGLNSL